jgi:serine protease Do
MTHSFTRHICPAFFLAMLWTSAYAQPISSEHNYAKNSPGVAMVQTFFSATVYVNKVTINQQRFNELVESIKRLDTTRTMLSSEKKLDMVVKALYNNPLRYFSRTTEYLSQQHRIVSNGTGFFVTGDGYLITNCHVIDRDSAYIRQKFILSTFQEVADANIQSLQSSWAMTLTEEQRNLLYSSYSLIYSQLSSMILFDLKKEMYIIYRVDNENNTSFKIKKPARLIIKGQPMPGKDVAILKLDDVNNLPTLDVRMDSVIRIGGKVLVFGYPEPASTNVYLASESNSEPTLTSGIISSIRQSVGGFPVIQMDAIIAHGSSGSPVCNEEGEVIGLATFGSWEQTTGSLAPGYNFAIPVSVIKEFLDSAHVQPQASESSALYSEGLAFFHEAYYGKALQKFRQVKKIYGNYPQLYYYETLSKNKIAAHQDRQSFTETNFFRIMALIIILGAGYLFYRWMIIRHETYRGS